MGNLFQLERLPLDIIYEILGHLSVEDIARTRRVRFPFYTLSVPSD